MNHHLLVFIIIIIHTNAFGKDDASPYFVICGETIHFALAVVDLWSDVNLLLEIQGTQKAYEDNQEKIDASIESNQYTFDECLSSDLASEWQNVTRTYCQCEDFDVECDGYDFVIEEIDLFNNLSMNTTADVISTMNEYIDIANQYVSCKEDSNVTTWKCNKCDCIGNEYSKEESISLMRAIQEYDDLGPEQIQYCNPNILLTVEYNEYLSDIVIVCWTFLIIGSIIQCCALCARWYFSYVAVNEHEENSLIFKLCKLLIEWTVCFILCQSYHFF